MFVKVCFWQGTQCINIMNNSNVIAAVVVRVFYVLHICGPCEKGNTRVHMSEGVLRPKIDAGYLVFSLSTLLFETHYFTESGAP